MEECHSRVYASKEKLKSMNKEESVTKEKFDDDDDEANIPEDEHEVEIEL